MADTKISALTSATTPLAGTEVLPIVQSSTTVKVSVANLTEGRAVSMLSGTISSGNLAFSTTGQRITGDFNNGTVTNRVLFQNSTVNDNTIVGALPNGSAAIAGFVAYGLSTAANSSTLDLLVRNDAANAVQIRSNRQGTGTFLPMQFFTSGGKKFEIDTSGNATVTTAAGLGYSTGSGGTVTQATSRTTGVTLNKPTGAITMFSDLGSAVAATFTVTNSLVAATDTILLSQQSGTNLYVLLVTAVAAGSFNITFYTTGGVTSDTPVINFTIIKGATS